MSKKKILATKYTNVVKRSHTHTKVTKYTYVVKVRENY